MALDFLDPAYYGIKVGQARPNLLLVPKAASMRALKSYRAQSWYDPDVRSSKLCLQLLCQGCLAS